MSVPTLDRAVWRASEPGTAPPQLRLRALERLVEAGVHAGVLAAPILPGLSDAPERLEETVRAAAAHGARFLHASLLHLGPLVRGHYLNFLDAEHPDLLPLYRRLYPAKYAPRDVRDRLHAEVAALKEQYGIRDLPRPAPASSPLRQLALSFA